MPSILPTTKRMLAYAGIALLLILAIIPAKPYKAIGWSPEPTLLVNWTAACLSRDEAVFSVYWNIEHNPTLAAFPDGGTQLVNEHRDGIYYWNFQSNSLVPAPNEQVEPPTINRTYTNCGLSGSARGDYAGRLVSFTPFTLRTSTVLLNATNTKYGNKTLTLGQLPFPNNDLYHHWFDFSNVAPNWH